MSENIVTNVVPFVKVVPSNVKYHISDSNKKLVPSTDCAFLIWNIPAVVTCPFRTEHCEKYCYAKKAECAYPAVLPARYDNLEMSKLPTFVTDMTSYIIDRAKRMRKNTLIVRIHESGDFYNQEYANKWLEIMNNVANTEIKGKTVKFIAYTKSFKYFDGVVLPEFFTSCLYLG